MKNYLNKIIVLLALIILVVNLPAQNLILEQSETNFNDNVYPSFKVILEPSPDEVKDAWEDFIKDQYDVKMKGNGLFTNKEVLRAEQVKISSISAKEMDFYTRIVEKDNSTELSVFGSFGYDIPITQNEYPNEYEAMEIITKRFLQSYLPDYYNEWIEETQKHLSDLNEDREDMQKEMKKNKEEIEKLTKRNEELYEELEENQQAIENTTKRLADKKETFSEVNARLQSFQSKQLNK